MNHKRFVRSGENRKRMSMCLLLTVSVFVSSFLFSGCLNDGDQEEQKPAEYGDYGKNAAISLAMLFPERIAYSEQEREAGQYIRDELERLGYDVQQQEFYDSQNTRKSANYIVKIPGEGFMIRGDEEQYTAARKTVIVGAHYDIAPLPVSEEPSPDEELSETTEETESSEEPVEDGIVYDGVHANASGVACLLTVAMQIREQNPAYDVILVAFGAGADDFRGARQFLHSLSIEETKSIDVMYCVDSIYAGDKLYASAGHQSVEAGRKYELRRKLYEAYDVVYNNTLRSQNGVDLYYNMSGIYTDLNEDGILDIYREVTLNRSDYIPFDELGIPIVFFESYDYNATALSEMKETKNLNLQEFGGMIRGTPLDSYEFLDEELGPDRLPLRINNTAFIIIEAINRGMHNAVPVSRYNAGDRLEPLIRVTETIPYQGKKTG